jgi:hypothetical protein
VRSAPAAPLGDRGKLVAVITEEEHPSSVEANRRPWRSRLIILAVAFIVIGLVGLGLGVSLWVSHVSFQACMRSYPPSRPSQAMLNLLIARCRSVGAWHNRGIVLTYSGVAAVLVGVGTALATRWSSTR